MLKDRYDNMEDVEIMIGELRREFTETIFELQKEIEDIKQNKYIVDNSNENEKKDDNINYSTINKVKDIEKLLKMGKGVDEVASMLNIGKGEVLLIQELYIK